MAEAALFATIWLAVVLFVAGESGKRAALQRAEPVVWAWYAWAAGAVLCAVHMALALRVRYEWSHRAALDATASQTREVYGLAWSGGLYVNYVFLAVWTAELVWWRLHPENYFRRGAVSTWTLRTFYFIVLFNAAVVFTSRWIPGAVLLGVLIFSWRPSADVARP